LKNIAIFASGRGSNFNAILKKQKNGKINGEIVCVISDCSQPIVFKKAESNNIPTHTINIKQFKTGEEYTNFLIAILEKYKIDLIILAGFLKLIPSPIVKKYKNAIINIHPALLPNFGGKGFYGKKVHKAVIESGIKITGITIHFVDEHYDTGNIILQEKIEVLPNDTDETLALRVLELEHKFYPEVVKAICDNQIKIDNKKIIWER